MTRKLTKYQAQNIKFFFQFNFNICFIIDKNNAKANTLIFCLYKK